MREETRLRGLEPSFLPDQIVLLQRKDLRYANFSIDNRMAMQCQGHLYPAADQMAAMTMYSAVAQSVTAWTEEAMS